MLNCKRALMAVGFLAAGFAVATVSTPSQATELGYGMLVGTWNGNISQSAADIDDLEALIRDAWDGDPNGPNSTFANLGLGGDPDPLVNNLNPAGKVDCDCDGTNGRLSIDADGNDGGSWEYLSLAEAGATPPPTDEIIDLYLLVKYGNYFSVWYYNEVDPLNDARDSGLYSIADPTLYGSTYCDESFIDANPGALCIAAKYKTGNPNTTADDRWDPSGISHVEGYWPRISQTDTPEPATLALIGAGMVGFAAMRRRRRA